MTRVHPSYREAPPDAREIIVWPEDFGTRFTVFVDVEEEFDWSGAFDSAHRSTRAMAAFPAAHRRFAEDGVALACMVDHPIATDAASVSILSHVLEDGRSSIGAQLHPWVNPPFADAAGLAESYAGNLPLEQEGAKIEALGQAIEAAWGTRPIAYRAGRYGIGPNTRSLLAACGYRIDTSVRAHYDYSSDSGPDFSTVGAAAYRRGGLAELPLTTVFTGRARRHGTGLYPRLGRIPHLRGLVARSGGLSRIALTPEDMPIDAALEAAEVAVGEGLRLLTLSFHSPSLAPGNTPYVRDAADLKLFHRWWDAMLRRFATLGVENASLAEIVDALDRA